MKFYQVVELDLEETDNLWTLDKKLNEMSLLLAPYGAVLTLGGGSVEYWENDDGIWRGMVSCDKELFEGGNIED